MRTMQPGAMVVYAAWRFNDLIVARDGQRCWHAQTDLGGVALETLVVIPLCRAARAAGRAEYQAL